MSDKIFFNGTILTMNPDMPAADAVAVRDSRILAVGYEADVRAIADKNAETIDLQGHCLMPGFHDSHVHLVMHGFELNQLHLDKTKTVAEALELIAERTAELSAGSWILGSGFLMARWNVQDLHKKDLDRISPNHPVFLRSQDHHSAWVNSVALNLAGITPSTPQPHEGEIVKDDTGEPTGMLLERASYLVQQVMPKPTREDIRSAVQAAGEHLASLGITTAHHMAAEPASYFREMASLASTSDYPVRVWACLDQEDIEHAAEIGVATGQGGEHFQIGGAKFFADGALGSMTALMLEPYTGTTAKGFEVHSRELMRERFPLAIKAGLVPVIHSIGDAANRVVLDCLEETKHLWQPLNMRPRIEHAQHLHEDDIPRFARLGVTASMQPIHYRFDAKRIGELLPDRLEQAHAWRSLIEAGSSLPLGSDTPVATPDVMLGLYTACSRVAEDGSIVGSQKLTIDEALAGYTKHAAYAISWEHRSGQIKFGYDADFVLLSHDPHEGLENLTVKATMKAGRWTYQK
jgi:predicted amidohydrolase YtcJ